MGKDQEKGYIAAVVREDRVNRVDFERYLLNKPYADPLVGGYLIDLGQILRVLPPPPGRLLDLGCGSGWTSEMLALSGYEVTGVDIAEDMIELAQRRERPGLALSFHVGDFENQSHGGPFDAVVSYDALHHAEDERAVLTNLFTAMRPGGMLVLIEPGRGHSTQAESLDAVRKYGVTERDMPFELIASHLRSLGFTQVKQHLRLSQVPLVDLPSEQSKQMDHFVGWLVNTVDRGLTSVVVGVK